MTARSGLPEGVSVAKLEAPGEERYFSLRRALGVTSFGCNLIELAPRQRGRIHEHREQEEVYLVWAGTLTLAFGPDNELALGRGEAVRVAPEVKRQLLNRGGESCLVVALGGTGEHAGRDGTAYESWASEEGAPPQEIPLPPDLGTN